MRSDESTVLGWLIEKKNKRKATIFVWKYEKFLSLIERELECDEIFAALLIKDMQNASKGLGDEDRRSIEKILAKLSLRKLVRISQQTEGNPSPEEMRKKNASENLKGKYRENLSSVDDFLKEKKLETDW